MIINKPIFKIKINDIDFQLRRLLNLNKTRVLIFNLFFLLILLLLQSGCIKNCENPKIKKTEECNSNSENVEVIDMDSIIKDYNEFIIPCDENSFVFVKNQSEFDSLFCGGTVNFPIIDFTKYALVYKLSIIEDGFSGYDEKIRYCCDNNLLICNFTHYTKINCPDDTKSTMFFVTKVLLPREYTDGYSINFNHINL